MTEEEAFRDGRAQAWRSGKYDRSRKPPGPPAGLEPAAAKAWWRGFDEAMAQIASGLDGPTPERRMPPEGGIPE